jgi:hypothetical protein
MHYQIQVREIKGNTVATARLKIAPDVWVQVKAVVSQKAIKNLLTRTFRGRIPPGESVSGFFGKLWKGVKKVAKKVANSKVIKGAYNVVKKVVKNPIFQGALTAIPGVGTVIGPTLAAATTAYAGVKAATASKKGNKREAKRLMKRAKTIAKKAKVPKQQFYKTFQHGMDQAIDPRMWQMMIYGARMFGPKLQPYGQQMPAPYMMPSQYQ